MLSEVVNSQALDIVLEQKFVDEDEIFLEQRWRGTLHSDMNLRAFPYDHQELRIDVESSFHATTFIKLVTVCVCGCVALFVSLFSPFLSLSAVVFVVCPHSDLFLSRCFLFSSLSPFCANFFFLQAEDDASLYSVKCEDHSEFSIVRAKLESTINGLEFVTEDDADFQRYSLVLQVARRSGFYVFKVGLVNVICVVIGCSINFISPDAPGDKLGLTTTMFLTLVAFQFVVADQMPKISYFTLLDYMVLICYLMMGATILQSLVQYNRWNQGEDPALLFEADLAGFITLVGVLFVSVAVLSFIGLRSWMKGLLFMARAE